MPPAVPPNDLLTRVKVLAHALGVWVLALAKSFVIACWTRGWPLLRLIVRRLFEVLLALILLFEEWGWRPLATWIAQLSRFEIVARIERVIAGLPPYGALAAFLLPSALLFPLKLLALYLIATGHTMSAAFLFVAAKIAGTAVLARLFLLTQSKLMQIGWFARLYNLLMPWKDRMFAAIRASWGWRYGRILKHKVGPRLKAQWAAMRPHMIGMRDRLRAQAQQAVTRIGSWWGRQG